jgi:hypothetical protein
MRFREGMRRLIIAGWWVTAIPMFLFYSDQFGWGMDGLGYGIAFVAGYGALYWLAVFIVRWIWTGFMGPERAE